jgi:N-acetylglucosamine-6-phosphate deacetylase
MSHLIQITNARLVEGDCLVSKSLWFDSEAGVFVSPPNPAPASAIDLQGRIVAPGFLDLQINGAYGFDFSEDIAGDPAGYNSRFLETRRRLITTGTTSLLPTMTSQMPERYHQVGVHDEIVGSRPGQDSNSARTCLS